MSQTVRIAAAAVVVVAAAAVVADRKEMNLHQTMMAV